MNDLSKIVDQMTVDEKIAQLTGLVLPYLYSLSTPADGTPGTLRKTPPSPPGFA
jgi:hypothetical protein